MREHIEIRVWPSTKMVCWLGGITVGVCPWHRFRRIVPSRVCTCRPRRDCTDRRWWQPGVAAHVMDQRPEHARAALNTITDASREALRELRSILAVLRHVDDEEARSPAPRLADLGALLRATRL